MDRLYKDTPENFASLEPYIVTNRDDIIKAIIQAEKCYFYDTCSFRNHMIIEQPDSIFNYIKQTNGIIIITRCILMELCSKNSLLWDEHIAYIQKFHQSGIPVLVLFEEDVWNVLSFCYIGVATINKMLSIAVKHAKSKTGTVEKILQSNSALKKELLIDASSLDNMLATRFFGEARTNKTSGDHLGEELIAICVHMLSNIRENKPNKYIVLSDDKGAISLLSRTMQNVEKSSGMRCITGVTTAKLCWLLSKNTPFTDKIQIESILGNPDDPIKIFCSEEYELEPIEKTMKIGDLSEKLFLDRIKIYF